MAHPETCDGSSTSTSQGQLQMTTILAVLCILLGSFAAEESADDDDSGTSVKKTLLPFFAEAAPDDRDRDCSVESKCSFFISFSQMVTMIPKSLWTSSCGARA